MQLKHLFVSFLAFGSAIAAANPAVNDHDGVEARGDSTKSCPQAMYYDKSKGKCSCSPGYYWETNSCRPRCGSDNSAYYSSSSDNCICRNKAMRFNSSKRGCDCGQGKTWDSYGNKCVNSCGGGASLVKGQCTCPSSAQKYDTSKKTCSNRCQPGTTWNGSKCVSSCKAGTSWNGSKCVSVCKAGTSWNGSKCTSICKAGETYNGSKCVSSCKSGETYNGSKCVSVCKAGTSWNGSKCTSICKSGETYNGSKCVSSCKSGETWNGSKCVSSCKTGETWNGSKCVSVCKDGATYRGNACQCPKPGYEYKNSKCVLSQPCGTEATLKSGVCVCNQDTMDYNTATKKCACPRDYEWNKSAGKCTETCKDGATREGNVCKCPKDGYEYEYSKCVLHCGYEAHAESGACVCNQDTKVFDTTSKKCACPKDTEWNKRAGKCTEVCGGESNYNTRTNACECSGGRVYKNKACACPEKTIFKNGKCVPDCGTSAWYNTYKEECVCKTEGQEYDTEKGCGCFKAGEVYNKDKKACVPDCGTSAWYNTYKEECVCKTEGQEYDAEKGCGCFKEDETYDEDEKACLPNCGDAAGWSSFHKECRCRNSNLDYDSEHKTCGCKEGYELKDKACSPICPSDAKYVKADGNTPATCACIKDGYDWDSVKTSCVSKCPKDADWESTKCVCHNSNYESIDGGECKCPAGSISRSRGRCEPACEHGAEWSHRKNGCVCKEPNTKYTTEACVCADGYVANADSGECEPKCPSSAYFKDGKCHCKNSAFEFYEAEDNGKGMCRCADDSIAWGPEKKYCKPNCGKYADWRGEKCVCKLKDSTYVEKDVECECKTGYSLNKVGECRPTCPDSADYSPATDGKEATCECRGDGLSYDKDTNSCSPICPDTATYVKATETDPATCKCKAQSKKFEDGECVNKCPSDASYVPKDGTKEETCRCLSDYKLWNGESCKPKCADGQKPVKDEDAETFTCQCRDESKKAVGDLCKPKCPQDSTYAPKTDKAPETCKCDNKHLEYRNDECQCPEETEPHGKFCVPVCIEKASFKRGRGCVCDDEKAELVGDKEKKCQCIKGYVPDTNTGKCVAFCPSNADFVEGTDGELDSCTCKNSELEYKEKECKCPKGSSLEGDFCKPDTCPKGAHVDKTTKPWSCACDVDGAEVKGENEAAECKCPALKPRTLNGKCVACPTGSSVSEDGKSCVCEAGRYINHLDKCLCDNLKEPQGNKCQPNCGLLAKVSGDVCECYVKNAMFVDKDKSCPCPTGSKKYLADILKGKFECRCDQALLKDSVFNADKTKCECAQGFKPVDKKCVPDCTAPLVASGNKCVCPTESHKVVPVSGGPDKCIPLCQVIDPNPVYKRTPITIPEECFCDPAKYDWLSDVEKCSERCPTGFKHKAGDSTGLCVCDESTHGENTDGQCVPICVDYSPAPPDRRRNTVTPPAACFCDPKTHKSYEDGSVCVPNCPAPGETHNKDDNYECFCDPSTSGEVEVNGELTCVENCYVGVPAPPPGKKRTDDPAPPATCFCDGGVDGAYDDSIPGLCLEKCPRGEEHKPDGDHECWCNTETSTTDLTGTCLPNCNDSDPINAGKPNECYCNEKSQHAVGETCKPRCDELQAVDECFCDVDSHEWENKNEKCVKPCDGAFEHDLNDPELKCTCDTTKNHYDAVKKTCTPLCKVNHLINKDTPQECYCNDQAPSTLVKKNGYCVEACTIKNHELTSALPPVCACPDNYYTDGAEVCLPRCTDGKQFTGTPDACYCDDTGYTPQFEKVGQYCFEPCTKKNEKHAAAFPHACECPTGKFVVGDYCHAPCNEADKFDGENGCYCPEEPTSDWDRVMSDGTCRKKCPPTEMRDPMTRTCKCKTDATRPLAGAACECPANSKPKAAACECDDPANKVMFNKQCVDKCMDTSKREERLGNANYGKCVCTGQKSFYDTTAKKCKCPGGKQFREGQCRDYNCPNYSDFIFGTIRTRYDERLEKCVCMKANNRDDDPGKTYSERWGTCS